MFFQFSLYYLSFTPLWISILFIEGMSLFHGSMHRGTELISLVLIPLVFLVSILIMKNGLRATSVGSVKYELMEAHEEKLATAEFLATFIIPLFAFDFVTWEGMVLFGIFFLIFGCLCIRHNYLCTNIILDLLGYRIYECKLVDSHKIEIMNKIISKRNLKLLEKTTIFAKALNNDYGFDCYKEESSEEV